MATAAVLTPESAAPVAELAVVQAPLARRTLYALEETIAAMVDTVEMVEPDQEQAFLEQFQEALKSAVEKRDDVGHFMAHYEDLDRFADFEIQRLQERRAYCRRVLDRLEKYVSLTIKSLGVDAKGKWKKLEGRVTTFTLKKCPPSVDITDAEAIPAAHKTVTLTLPLPLYDELLNSLDLDFAGKIKAKIDVTKASVKEDLQAKVDVPGARLVDDKYRLVRS